MGAEGAPRVEVEGALAALTSPEIDVVLVGDETRVRRVLDEMGSDARADASRFARCRGGGHGRGARQCLSAEEGVVDACVLELARGARWTR